MDQLFTWRNEDSNPEKILKVELLITRANSVHCDPFFTQDEPNSNLDVYSMTSVDGQLTYTRTVNLSLGVYHFLYKITTVEEAWLETIHSKYKTVLGSGRPVNYIEVGDASPKSTNSFSDCINIPDEYSPLLSSKKECNPEATVVQRKGWCCCSR
ncbi:uncharacterized protein LOC130622728 isoform X1 [Hydractinia symbiolongicarpus]|uniref:uncharacterized protein LOC130622728 isoform X1 n=1 Tax=Hydractinia symbiolongicarpus TaxID=13093 RepID=UPI00254F67AC|nr:uncharacterized protein LOC130622728 isoform X1 [Hydractinia symbiolongicarpus]XP_057294208.1 uncharacterized protein LOC130622728 isoform X1 [Hydractinia symbiolongicarpus]